LTRTPLAIDDPRAESVLASLLEGSDRVQALRGSARVAIDGPDFELNRPQRIAVERPARLRFEVVGLFDQLAAVLVTDGREFGFYDAAENRIQRGRITPGLMWRLARLDLDVHEAVGILLGTPRPSPGLSRAAVWVEGGVRGDEAGVGGDGDRLAIAFAWPGGGDAARAECLSEPGRGLVDRACFAVETALDEGGEVFLFDGAGRLLEMRSLGPERVLRYRATFEDHAPLDEKDADIVFPRRITVRSPALESEARFDWKRVVIEEALPNRLFTLPEQRASGGRGG